MNRKLSAPLDRRTDLLIATGLLIFIVALTALAAEKLLPERLAFGFDWALHWHVVRGGGLIYIAGNYNPPWTFLWLWPLGWLSFRSSWGVFTVFTLLILILCVPRTAHHRLDLAGLGWLMGSYVTLRQIADGNLTALVIAGCLLVEWSYRQRSDWGLALGVLLLTTKMQESALALAALALSVVWVWPRPRWRRALLIVLLVIAPSLLIWGADWGQALRHISDELFSRPGGGGVTLTAITGLVGQWPWVRLMLSVSILGITAYLTLASPTVFNANKIAALVSASLLLSPYANVLSLTTVLAVGVMALRQRHIWLGTILAAFTSLPLLTVFVTPLPTIPNYYWAVWLVACWSAFCWQLSRQIRSATLAANVSNA